MSTKRITNVAENVVSEQELANLAKRFRHKAEKNYNIEGIPWVSTENFEMEDIYTDLTINKLNFSPMGPQKTNLVSYTELFENKVTTPSDNDQDEDTQTEQEGEKVLFQGESGMGKTSLMKKVTCDWVKGIFTVFTIVFFVSLKLVRPGDPIENIIIDQNPKLKGLKVSPQKLRAILENFGNKCLLILDGFDESDVNNSEVLKLLRGEVFLNCNVLVTSRPHSVPKILKYFDKVCEISGFQSKHAAEYISRRLEDKDKTHSVLAFCRRNFTEAGGSLQLSPLILLFVCTLVDGNDIELTSENVPLAEIYLRIVRSIYRNYIERCNSSNEVKREFRKNEFVAVLRNIAKVAWQTLITGRNCCQKVISLMR